MYMFNVCIHYFKLFNYYFKLIAHIYVHIYAIKNFCSVKDSVRRMKRQAADWEKIFINHISDQKFVSKICKELSKLNSKKN